MDIFNVTRLAEQTVYETVSWLYFYPATLLRVLLNPAAMMEYARRETEAPPDLAFAGAMRPALLLLISIVIGTSAFPLADHEFSLLPHILKGSWLNLVLSRFIAFGIFPMVAAILCDLFTPGEVTRQSLLKPFNQQAYIYAPFALIVSPALVLVGQGHATALAAIGVMLVWVVWVQVLFFQTVWGSLGRSFATALSTVLIGIGLNVLLVAALGRL